MQEGSGFEIYKTIEAMYIKQGIDNDIGTLERHWLETREALELIKAQYYKIESQAQEPYLNISNQLIRQWLNKLITVSSEVWKASIEEFEHISDVKVEKTEVEFLAKPGININADFMDLNIIVSSACQFSDDKDE